MLLKILVFCASVTVLQAQTPVERAWEILQSGAADKSPEKRAKAIHALGLLTHNEKARPLAEKALQDEKPEVRAAGAVALGQMGASASVGKLKEAIKDKEMEVVFAATNALFLLHDPAAYEVYYAVLTGEKKSGEGLVESQMKILKDPKALAKLGFEQGIGYIPFAGVGYGVFKTVTRDDTSPVRAAAAHKLANDPDPKSGEVLAKSAADQKWLVRAAVADALARRGDPALLNALLPLLNDSNDTVQYNAAAAVVQLSESDYGKNK